MFHRIYLGAIVCGVSLGLFGEELQRLHRQAQAIPKLHERGFEFLCEDTDVVPHGFPEELREAYRPSAVVGWCNDPLANNGDLRLLRDLPYLTCLNLSGTQVTKGAERYLGHVKSLRYLILHGTNLTRRNVVCIRACLPECEVDWAPDPRRVQPRLRFTIPRFG
jgi:hypothetical protein